MAFSVFDILLHIFIIGPKERRNVLKDGRKLHKCLYCSKWVFRIPEHMKSIHKKEVPVLAAMKLSKKEQIEQFAILRRKGDFQANLESVKYGSKYTVVVPKTNHDIDTEK